MAEFLTVILIFGVIFYALNKGAKAQARRAKEAAARHAKGHAAASTPESPDATSDRIAHLELQTHSEDPVLRTRARQVMWRLQHPHGERGRATSPAPPVPSKPAVPPVLARGGHTAPPARVHPPPVPSETHEAERESGGEEAERSEAAPSPPPDLLDALEGVRALPRFGSERKTQIGSLEGREASFTVEVEHVQRTSGAENAWAEGSTVTGTVQGSSLPLAVRLPPARRAEANALARGSAIHVVASFVAWDKIFDRPVFQGDYA